MDDKIRSRISIWFWSSFWRSKDVINLALRKCLILSWRRPLSYRNQSIDCSANQWTGFYMITAAVMKELTLWVFVFPGPGRFAWPSALALSPDPGPQPWPQIFIYRPWPPICIYRPWPPICIYRAWHQICIYQLWPPICIYRLWPPICIYRLNPSWVCIYRPCLPNLYLLALA